MSTIRRRPGVDDDIFELAAYLLSQSEPAGHRFVDAVQQTLKELALHPGIGSPKQYDETVLADGRSWAVRGFSNHLIYHLPRPDGIDVLAVLHGSRDVPRELRRRV